MKAVIITSTLLGIAAILIRKIFGNRVGIKPFIIMWAVVFIKFALPFELPSPLSVMNLFSEKAVTEAVYEAPTELSESENIVENLTEKSQNDINAPQRITEAPKYEQVETESGFDLSEFAETVYFSITAMLLFCIVFAYIIFTVKFHRLPRLEDELCKKIIAEFGIKRKISVHSGEIDTPAVFGVLCPVIILPENTAAEDNEKLIRHIMLHEICHIKHFDTLWNILTLMICAINWYNPIVWICRYMYLADTEKLCDMNVLKLIGDENRREYANSLLEYAVSRQNPVTLISGFGEGGIKSRIKSILSIKKVRIAAVISAAAVIIAAAFIFGTGKSISVSTGETVSKTSDTGELWFFSQMLEDDEGEAGKLVVRVYNRNVFYVDISLKSDKYTLDDISSKTVLKNASFYQIYNNNNEVEYSSADNEKGYFDRAVYEMELDPTNPDYSISVGFYRYSGNAGIEITLDYTLKKGIYDAGEHSFTFSFDPLNENDYLPIGYDKPTYVFTNLLGYNLIYNEKTLENEFHSAETGDVYFTISDNYDGFYAKRNVYRTEYKQHYDIDPSQITNIMLYDVNSDGIGDILIHFGYDSDSICFINGLDVSKIVVNDEKLSSFLNISVEQLSDIEFKLSCGGTEHIFTLDSPIEGKYLPDNSGDIIFYEDYSYYISDNNKLKAQIRLFVSDREKDNKQSLTYADVEFKYSDGELVPVSIDVDTTDNIYYIKDELAAKAGKVYYKYETTGYNFPYTAELVKAKGSYFIRSVNPLTGIYYGSCELPIEKLPKDIESCFKFSSGLFFAEAVIVYSPPADNSPSENQLYNATFIVFDNKGKPQIADIIGTDGSRLEELQISDSFTSESGFMNDSYLSRNGKVNLRMERTNNTIQIIDMVYNDDNYRTLEKLDPKLGATENDTAQTVLYNADGTIIKKLPIVNGRVSYIHIISSAQLYTNKCRYLGSECEVSGEYTVTEVSLNGESYTLTIYDSGFFEFSYNDITEFYELNNAEDFRSCTIYYTLDYMDTLVQSFIDGLYNKRAVMLSLIVDDSCGLGSPNDWQMLKTLTVISDVTATKLSGDDNSCIYRVTFNINSLDPTPFKNGENVYNMTISVNEKYEAKITSFLDVTE